MATNVKIAGVQMDVQLGEIAANLEQMQTLLKETATAGARVTIFPECALTGYCFRSLADAMEFGESIPGPSVQAMADTCRELDTFAVFGMLEKVGEQLYNVAVLMGPQGLIGCYRKVHLPYLGVDRFTTPGDRPFEVYQAGPVKIGMHICYDGAFPEAARVLALKGAELIVLPTNWPPGAEYMAQYLISARALENKVYFAAVDRIGEERGFKFIGESRICAPDGSIMTAAHHTDFEILYADIDIEIARNKHIVRIPTKHEINRFRD
ncbi:MAG: putative amidohydrolase, partial [Pirellulaceae bacterium]